MKPRTAGLAGIAGIVIGLAGGLAGGNMLRSEKETPHPTPTVVLPFDKPDFDTIYAIIPTDASIIVCYDTNPDTDDYVCTRSAYEFVGNYFSVSRPFQYAVRKGGVVKSYSDKAMDGLNGNETLEEVAK